MSAPEQSVQITSEQYAAELERQRNDALNQLAAVRAALEVAST
jgi:hypothetical protein